MSQAPETSFKLSPFLLFRRLAIQCIRAYQVVLGPHLGGRCRFTPPCSDYSIEAIDKYGIVKGLAKAVKRISKCGPWHPGGHDPVN